MTMSTASPARVPQTAVPDARWAGLRRRVSWPLLALLTLATALRLALWDRAYGFEQGDPVEYVNIAYRIAFGIGIEWWDLRPLLLSLIYVPVMLVMQWWPDPTGEAMVRALRLVGVLFSIGSVALTYAIGRQLGGGLWESRGQRLADVRRHGGGRLLGSEGRLGGEVIGLTAGLLVAANPVFNRLSVSTFAEVPSTFFVLLAVWLLIRPRQGAALLDMTVLAGLAFGLGCMIRYQAIAYVAPFGLWLLVRDVWRLQLARWPAALVDRRSRSLRFGLGLAAAAFVQAVVETVAYGRPFHSLLVSFQYNVTSGLAPVEFGSEPFEWFLLQSRSWFGSLPALLALIGLLAMVRGPRVAEWRLVGLAAATMFLLLSALPHKEERFMTQVVPLLALFAGAGVATIASLACRLFSRSEPSASRTYFAIAAFLALLAAAPLLRASWTLDVRANVAYVDGAKRAAELKPGGTLGTIPWFVPRPYTGTRLALERMDRNVWNDRERVARTIEQSDFLLFPEYWLLEDRAVDRLVEAGFRSIESYDNGVALYQSRRLDDPPRRRPRS